MAPVADSYHLPRANQCIQRHGHSQRPAGAAPIGPKPRNLMLKGAPSLAVDPNTQIATNVERIPHFNVPGDSGLTAGSDKAVEARLRGYLEGNCAHCHNEGGESSNTGLYLDTLRAVDAHYGICKTPTAAGAGAGGHDYDIQPTSAADSILPYRMSSNDPEVQMPPIARSIVHQEALALVKQWINQVVDDSYTNADSCSGGNGVFSVLNNGG